VADVDIVVDSGDLKAAIDLLNEYGMSFTQMVNRVQTEGNRLARASKATASQVEQALDRAQSVINNQKLEQAAKDEAQTLKRREQNWKQFFQQDYLKGGTTGINASNSVLLKQLETQAAEEQRILKLREQSWKQFFQQDFMKGPSAGESGAPNSAASSALVERERALADAMKETTAAAQSKEREIAALTAKYNPLLAAEGQYRKLQGDINRAHQLGVIDAKQMAAALNQLDTEYKALSSGVYLAGSRFNQFGEMAGISGKAASRFGMYAQQAGYQIGDFAVQLQSGTNAGVAFSQQAAQLAGLIPGLAGALTTFAAIGLGLVIQSFTRGKKEAEETYASISDFDDLDRTFKNLGLSVDQNLTQSISRVRQEYGAFIADIARSKIQGTLDQIKGNSTSLLQRQATVNDPSANAGFWGRTFQTPNTSLEATMEAARAAREYNDVLAQVQAAHDQLFNGSINSQAELVNRWQEFYETIEAIPGISQDILSHFIKIGEESGLNAKAVENINGNWTATNEAASKAFQTYKEQNEELRRSNALARVKLQYGENSIQYLNAERDQQLSIFETEMRRAGIKGTLLDNLIAQKTEQIAIEQAADRYEIALQTILRTLENISGIDISGVFTRAEAAANRLLGVVNAVGRGMAQLGRLGQEAAVLQAQNQALQEGKTPGQARVAGDVVRYGQSLDLPDNLFGRIVGGAMKKAYEANALQNLEYEEQFAAGTKAWNEANNPKKGGKKGGKEKKSDEEKAAEKAAKKLNEFYDQFEKNMEQQQRLIGVYGEQKEELEKIIEVENRLGEARHLVSDAQIEAMAREELALERRLKREQDLFNMASSSFESFLMDVVTGTASIEDAFKSMLASIIKEIYQTYVAKGAADTVAQTVIGLMSAKGNSFGAGGVKMFAKGGVVDSPTLFNYSGGTGMMGEAGPEAILPLKRNAQGKLGVEMQGGGSGDVNINNHWHIAANGDDTIRKVIQEQLPAITNVAKAAVVDAQRRKQGGFK